MSGLAAWILSILGVVIIGSIIDLLLPSGKMNKYIKVVFSTVTVLIIILPLPSLFKNGCSADNIFFTEDITIDESYINKIDDYKKESVIKGLKEALSNDGIILKDVYIEGDFSDIVPDIKYVRINFADVVIERDYPHINKYELIRNKVTEYLVIDKDAVSIYET